MLSSVGPCHNRVVESLPFVQQLARRMAASMPHSIDVGDLVQDGVIGLIDAARRFDETRGIKFETFAERRIRGAMIDALRKDAWPRGVRRQRRELEEARQALRLEHGCEPSLAELAARLGSSEQQLSRRIMRIGTIESTARVSTSEQINESTLPPVLVPSEPEMPDYLYEQQETRDKVLQAIGSLPSREQKVVSLYYYSEITMKQIGKELGVNESRVSQLHAQAIKRLRKVLGSTMVTEKTDTALHNAILTFRQKPQAVKAHLKKRYLKGAKERNTDRVKKAGSIVPYLRNNVSSFKKQVSKMPEQKLAV
tara:strand:- start:2943 stop:3872 length:930 start_codon:yes stop_codon:yes gene_type:complete